MISHYSQYIESRADKVHDDLEKLKAFITELAVKLNEANRRIKEWEEKKLEAKKVLREAEGHIRMLTEEHDVIDDWGIKLTGRLVELEKIQEERNE